MPNAPRNCLVDHYPRHVGGGMEQIGVDQSDARAVVECEQYGGGRKRAPSLWAGARWSFPASHAEASPTDLE